MIERRVVHSTTANDPDTAAFEKKQYEILLGQYVNFILIERKSSSFVCVYSYDHELKIQKARENARRTEKEKEIERYESLLHDFMVSYILKPFQNIDYIYRIIQWLMNVDKMNFVVKLINFINHDNFMKHYKQKITNSM
jgi:hypothetical protein